MTLAFRDMRWNSWRWRPLLERWGDLKVFINPTVLKTATFLCVDDSPCSTVFFVRVFIESGLSAPYAITTKHSLRDVVSIRFNLKKGKTEDVFFTAGDWIPHPATDIAVLPLEISLDSYDIEYVWTHRFAKTKDHLVTKISTHPPGLTLEELEEELRRPEKEIQLRYDTGDEIFTIGLFEGHTGEDLARPVARFGHIALKPADGERVIAEIESSALTPIDAFLVELATWRGQSGSPVFLRPWPASEEHRTLWVHSHIEETFLIGMIQGFYPGEQDVTINGQDAALANLQMGIGIVIPAKDISDVLMQDRLIEQRARLQREKQQNPKIRPRSA